MIRCMFYEINQGFQYIPRPLEGVKIPEKVEDDCMIIYLSIYEMGSNSACSIYMKTCGQVVLF